MRYYTHWSTSKCWSIIEQIRKNKNSLHFISIVRSISIPTVFFFFKQLLDIVIENMIFEIFQVHLIIINVNILSHSFSLFRFLVLFRFNWFQLVLKCICHAKMLLRQGVDLHEKCEAWLHSNWRFFYILQFIFIVALISTWNGKVRANILEACKSKCRRKRAYKKKKANFIFYNFAWPLQIFAKVEKIGLCDCENQKLSILRLLYIVTKPFHVWG